MLGLYSCVNSGYVSVHIVLLQTPFKVSIMAQWVEIERVEFRGAWWTYWFGAWWQWGHFGDIWQRTRDVEMEDEDHHCAHHFANLGLPNSLPTGPSIPE